MNRIPRRPFAFGAAAAATLSIVGRASGQAQLASIGTVERAVGGYGTPPGRDTRLLSPQLGVFEDEVVETLRDGSAQLAFLDGTTFRLGSASRATLDRFVFDPRRGSGALSLELGRGVFRFVSGRMDKSGYAIKTPTTTIGVRGTDFIVVVDELGDTRVVVLSGTVILGGTQLVQTDEDARVRRGQSIAVERRSLMQRIFNEFSDGGAIFNDSGGAGGSGGTAGGGGRGQP